MRAGALSIALSLILAAATAGTAFARDSMAAQRPARAPQMVTERNVIVDPDYVPGNPRCYLKREVAPSPQGGVLIYRQVC